MPNFVTKLIREMADQSACPKCGGEMAASKGYVNTLTCKKCGHQYIKDTNNASEAFRAYKTWKKNLKN